MDSLHVIEILRLIGISFFGANLPDYSVRASVSQGLTRIFSRKPIRSVALLTLATRRTPRSFDFRDMICPSFVFSYSSAGAAADKPSRDVSPGTTVAVSTNPFPIKKRPVNPFNVCPSISGGSISRQA